MEEKKSTFDDDIDGKPINLESSDNRPLALVADYDDEEDIDGKPISNSIDDIDGRPLPTAATQECLSNQIGLPLNSILVDLARPRFQEQVEANSSSTVKPRFVPTKWQSIDPNEVAAQGNRSCHAINYSFEFSS